MPARGGDAGVREPEKPCGAHGDEKAASHQGSDPEEERGLDEPCHTQDDECQENDLQDGVAQSHKRTCDSAVAGALAYGDGKDRSRSHRPGKREHERSGKDSQQDHRKGFSRSCCVLSSPSYPAGGHGCTAFLTCVGVWHTLSFCGIVKDAEGRTDDG